MTDHDQVQSCTTGMHAVLLLFGFGAAVETRTLEQQLRAACSEIEVLQALVCCYSLLDTVVLVMHAAFLLFGPGAAPCLLIAMLCVYVDFVRCRHRMCVRAPRSRRRIP